MTAEYMDDTTLPVDEPTAALFAARYPGQPTPERIADLPPFLRVEALARRASERHEALAKLPRIVFREGYTGKPPTERASYLQAYTGFDIPGIGIGSLSKEDYDEVVRYCRTLARSPQYDAVHAELADGKRKICTGCGEAWPRDSQHFYADARAKDGLYSECRWCHQNRMRKYRRRDQH